MPEATIEEKIEAKQKELTGELEIAQRNVATLQMQLATQKAEIFAIKGALQALAEITAPAEPSESPPAKG